MALINLPSKAPLTEAQKKLRVLNRIRAKTTELFLIVKNNYISLSKDVEENPEGLTREEVIDALGDDAETFFEFGKDLKKMINKAHPDTIPD